MYLDKLTPYLERIYRRKILTPIIVESQVNRFGDVAGRLRDLLPIDYINPQTGYHPLISKIKELVEFPMFGFKIIPRFNMVALPLHHRNIEDVADWSDVHRLYLDRTMYALQATVNPDEVFVDGLTQERFTSTKYTGRLIGVEEANSEGFMGQEVKVVALDTGARPTHPQLRGVNVMSAMKDKGGIGIDSNGHGTWIASTIMGSEVVDPVFNVPVQGMAPRCSFTSIQVLGFVVGMGAASDVIQGLSMADGLNVNILSLSLGAENAPSPEECPECKAIEQLTAEGKICCVAAGNNGPDASTIYSPGSAVSALTVGAWDQFKGTIADFSSRGPIYGEVKPDVVAPGVNVYSGCVGLLDAVADRRKQRYAYLSGTSMATPHVAGLLACIAQMYREKYNVTLTTDLVKTVAATYGNEEKNNNSGWGLIRYEWFKRYAAEHFS